MMQTLEVTKISCEICSEFFPVEIYSFPKSCLLLHIHETGISTI